jgi:hypothetical protein
LDNPKPTQIFKCRLVLRKRRILDKVVRKTDDRGQKPSQRQVKARDASEKEAKEREIKPGKEVDIEAAGAKTAQRLSIDSVPAWTQKTHKNLGFFS